MITVVLADDHPIVRAGLAAVLASARDVDVVGEAATAEEAVALVVQLRPQVVLMDLRFSSAPGGVEEHGGVAATKQLRELEQPPQVLIVTNYDSDAEIRGALDAGAVGYLLKDTPPDQLVAAIRAAASGVEVLSPAVKVRRDHQQRFPQDVLTPREVEVLQHVAQGLTNKDIGTVLFLSEATVKTHLVHIFDKLGVRSRTQAVSSARDRGIVP